MKAFVDLIIIQKIEYSNNNLNAINNFVVFKTETGEVNIDVFYQDKTDWLTQKSIAELFEKGRSTITEHIKRIFEDAELGEVSVCRDFRHTADDERLRQIKSDIPSFKLLEVIRKIYK